MKGGPSHSTPMGYYLGRSGPWMETPFGFDGNSLVGNMW